MPFNAIPTAPNKVKISWPLFLSIISLLEDLDLDDFSSDFIQHYGYVLYALNCKKVAVELRETSAKLINSNRPEIDW